MTQWRRSTWFRRTSALVSALPFAIAILASLKPLTLTFAGKDPYLHHLTRASKFNPPSCCPSLGMVPNLWIEYTNNHPGREAATETIG